METKNIAGIEVKDVSDKYQTFDEFMTDDGDAKALAPPLYSDLDEPASTSSKSEIKEPILWSGFTFTRKYLLIIGAVSVVLLFVCSLFHK